MNYWTNRLRTLVAFGIKPSGPGWEAITFEEYVLLKDCGWQRWRPINLEEKCLEKGGTFKRLLKSFEVTSVDLEAHRCMERCILWNGYTPFEIRELTWEWRQ